MEENHEKMEVSESAGDAALQTITINGEVMTEIEIGDEPPVEDDMSTAGAGLEDDVEEVELDEDGEGGAKMEDDVIEEEVVDMSQACFMGHTDCVYSAAVHPMQPGVIITGGGDDKAFLWKYVPSTASMETLESQSEYGTNVHQCIELGGHTDTVTSVGFNYDGSLALTGAYDGKVQIWNVASGALLQCMEGPEDVEFATWHPKGNAVLAGSRDGTAWMWLSHNGQCVQVFAGHEGGVSCGMFSSDGKYVITGGEDGTVRVWNPKKGDCRHVFEGHTAHQDSVTCMVSSPDGDRIASGGIDGKILLLQISGKRVLKEFQLTTEQKDGEKLDAPKTEGDTDEIMPSVECVGFCQAPEFNWIASGGSDKVLRIWDVQSGQCRVSCLHGGSVVSLKWHSSLPYVTTAALDNYVRVWDARSGQCVLELSGHTDLVTNLDMKTIIIAAEGVSMSGDSSGLPTPPVLTGGLGAKDKSTRTLDVIVSVSDDHTARVFHFNGHDLQQQQLQQQAASAISGKVGSGYAAGSAL